MSKTEQRRWFASFPAPDTCAWVKGGLGWLPTYLDNGFELVIDIVEGTIAIDLFLFVKNKKGPSGKKLPGERGLELTSTNRPKER